MTEMTLGEEEVWQEMKFKKTADHAKPYNPREPEAQQRKDSIMHFLFFTEPEILHFT